MTGGDIALAGDADAVREAAAWLNKQTVGQDVHAKLIAAATSLGGQSGVAVSVARILTLIQAASAPANLVQTTDSAWGSSVARYGAQIEDIQDRAKRALQSLADSETELSTSLAERDKLDASGTALEVFFRRGGLSRSIINSQENIATKQHEVQALDEERRTLNSSAARDIDEHRGSLASVQRTLPAPPRVSADVRVSARMPDGSERNISAVELAKLTDPRVIAAVWESLSTADRQKLIDDFPTLIGNLDGIPLRDRNTANILNAKSYRTELEYQVKMFELIRAQYGGNSFATEIEDLTNEIRSIDAMLGDRNAKYQSESPVDGQPFGTYLVFDENGYPIQQQGTVIVGFSPLRDSFITFQGALDPVTGNVPAWMEQVGVVVPGTNSRLAGFTADLDRGKDLFGASGMNSGYFTWHGAPMPRFEFPSHIEEAAERGFAEVAAPRLASFVNSLGPMPGTDVVPIAHSFGAAVLGRAELFGLQADRVVYVAPAGIGHDAKGIEDFPNTQDKPHFVLQARNDLVVGWNQGNDFADFLGLGHGTTNPLDAPNVVRLETGYREHGNASSGTIESVGGIDAHSSVFEAKSTSLRNITNVVKGDPVSLYHPNDIEVVPTFGGTHGPAIVEMPNSGAAKPEQLISPLNLEKVQ